MLCLNMSKMNYSVHLNWSLDQHRLLSHIELNLTLKDHYYVDHGGHGDTFIRDSTFFSFTNPFWDSLLHATVCIMYYRQHHEPVWKETCLDKDKGILKFWNQLSLPSACLTSTQNISVASILCLWSQLFNTMIDKTRFLSLGSLQ